MERRELYQPEDIERLLLERSFDDLLDEERAFVLQHLNGRNEYESMRALLLRMHEDQQDTEAMIDADPGVRDHLMAVFHAQQQPRWRIWLNSSLAWLTPNDLRDFWRPALAIGSLAAVVFVFLLKGRSLAPEQMQMAEVKNVHVEQPAAPPAPPTAVPETDGTFSTTVTDDANRTHAAEEDQDGLEKKAITLEAKEEVAQQQELAAAPVASAVADEAHEAPMAGNADSVTSAKDLAVDQPLSHQVTRNELYSNMSTAAAQVGTVSVLKQKAERAKERTAGQVPSGKADGTVDAPRNLVPQELLGVLRAAW